MKFTDNIKMVKHTTHIQVYHPRSNI